MMSATHFIWETIEENLKKQMLEVPALLTIYASNHYGKLTRAEIRAAVNYLKTETFAAPDFLLEYFRDVSQGFREKIEDIQEKLPSAKYERQKEIVNRLQPAKKYLDTLKESESKVFKKALIGFVDHVHTARKSILEELLFPVFFDHLNDKNIENLKRDLL